MLWTSGVGLSANDTLLGGSSHQPIGKPDDVAQELRDIQRRSR
jgi:hypothetical protein